MTEWAKVWLITGNDDEDDPAWGSSPVREGPADEVAAWLVGQPAPETLSITVGDSAAIWAREFLLESDDIRLTRILS